MAKTIQEIKEEIKELKATSRLHGNVINEILADSKGYNGTWAEKIGSRIGDIRLGCSSGVVGRLLYYTDTVKFYKTYKKEIQALLKDMLSDTGCSINELLKDYDMDDIFCEEEQNQNLLAWFGSEEVNNQLSYIFE